MAHIYHIIVVSPPAVTPLCALNCCVLHASRARKCHAVRYNHGRQRQQNHKNTNTTQVFHSLVNRIRSAYYDHE